MCNKLYKGRGGFSSTKYCLSSKLAKREGRLFVEVGLPLPREAGHPRQARGMAARGVGCPRLGSPARAPARLPMGGAGARHLVKATHC